MVLGAIPPSVCNAACNGIGKALRVTELQRKFGTTSDGQPRKELLLLADGEEQVAAG